MLITQNQFWSIDYQEKRSIDNLMAFLDESITLLITRIPQPLLCVDLIHCELIGFRLTSDDTVGRLVDVGRTASNWRKTTSTVDVINLEWCLSKLQFQKMRWLKGDGGPVFLGPKRNAKGRPRTAVGKWDAFRKIGFPLVERAHDAIPWNVSAKTTAWPVLRRRGGLATVATRFFFWRERDKFDPQWLSRGRILAMQAKI